MTDTTDVEEWEMYAKSRWPWMPHMMIGLLFVCGCSAPNDNETIT